MVNLSEGASSNGDIRAWIIYCAQPMTATSIRIWQPKKCRARPSRLQLQARVCLFDRRVNNMLLIRLFTQQWERMPPLWFASVYVCVCACKSVYFHKNVGWTKRAFFFSLFVHSRKCHQHSPCPLCAETKKRGADLWLKIGQNDKCMRIRMY